MTRFPEIFAALAAEFEPHDVKIRPAQGGRQLRYITARTAMNRLDSVLGPENWWDEYVPSQNSVLCKLTIQIVTPQGEVITVSKQDAGGYAGMADQGDDDKSGFSDSFKRACAKFGIARYLYGDGVPDFVPGSRPESRPQAEHRDAANGHRESPPPARSQQAPSGDFGSQPRSGKALFAWCKDMEGKHEVGLVKYLNGWAKLQEFPNRMIDFDAHQVELAFHEAIRKIRSIQPSRDDGMEDEAMSNSPAPPRTSAPGGGAGNSSNGRPTDPKKFKAWVGQLEDRSGLQVPILPAVLKWAKDEGMGSDPWKWSPEQLAEACDYTLRWIDARMDGAEVPQAPAPAPPPKAENHIPDPGPCTIDDADPLKAEKYSLKRIVKQVHMAEHASRPTEPEMMAVINGMLAEWHVEPIASLRECRDRRLVVELAEEFQAGIDARRGAAQ